MSGGSGESRARRAVRKRPRSAPPVGCGTQLQEIADQTGLAVGAVGTTSLAPASGSRSHRKEGSRPIGTPMTATCTPTSTGRWTPGRPARHCRVRELKNTCAQRAAEARRGAEDQGRGTQKKMLRRTGGGRADAQGATRVLAREPTRADHRLHADLPHGVGGVRRLALGDGMDAAGRPRPCGRSGWTMEEEHSGGGGPAEQQQPAEFGAADYLGRSVRSGKAH